MNNDKTFWIGQVILFIVAVVGLVMVVQPVTKASEIEVVNVTKNSVQPKEESKPTIVHTGYPSDNVVQKYVQYAYKISGGDIDFVAMLEAENGQRNPHRQSSVPDNKPGMSSNGREDSRGFCQLHRRRFKDIVDNPLFRSDPYWQLDRCFEKYEGGTIFYGYHVRHKVIGRFTFEKMHSHADNLTQKAKTIAGTYSKAIEGQKELETMEAKVKRLWKECILSGECKNGE